MGLCSVLSHRLTFLGFVAVPLQKILKFVFVFCIALVLAIPFSCKLLMPSFVTFEEMSSLLVSRANLSISDGLCRHDLERTVTREKVPLLYNASKSDLELLSRQWTGLKAGGAWSPVDCASKYRVNVIVPFRNRESHLWIFLAYLHQFLQRQEIEYRIVIVEQTAEKLFNRAKLQNIGFVEMERRHPADCYVFHDIDLIPLNLNNLYACSVQPRHISSALDVFDFKLPYGTIFGGAVALTRRQFIDVNGYSNAFFGWGGEDDDFYERVAAKYSVLRFEPLLAQMLMLNHTKEVPNPARFQTLRMGRQRYATDGIGSLSYRLVNFQQKPFFTWILAEL